MVKGLQKLREKSGATQEILAKQIGVSRPTYAQIEAGKRPMKLEEAKKLAGFFGLSLEDFASGKEPQTPKVEIKAKTKARVKKKPKMRISIPQERVVKFKEALLYILTRIGARPNIGEAVVCKLMYFIDFDYYEKFEEQLIGAVYIKNHYGPTPAAFPEIVKQMQKDGDIVRATTKHFQYDQKKYLPRREADLSIFSAREKDHIDREIERFRDFNSKQITEYSRKDVPWIAADDLRPVEY
ncbi:MAG: DUF4065 domain-containing protein, partial [Candidatus Dadabacteria bacterium]|nr:DUF4065 domain-containing protein [Candidatus Dadabacteria bacterium]